MSPLFCEHPLPAAILTTHLLLALGPPDPLLQAQTPWLDAVPGAGLPCCTLCELGRALLLLEQFFFQCSLSFLQSGVFYGKSVPYNGHTPSFGRFKFFPSEFLGCTQIRVSGCSMSRKEPGLLRAHRGLRGGVAQLFKSLEALHFLPKLAATA